MHMIRKHKSIIMVAALVLFFTGAFLLGNLYAQNRTEKQVQAASEKTSPEVGDIQTGSAENSEESGPQKEQPEARIRQMEQEGEEMSALQVSREMAALRVSCEMAQAIWEEMPDLPLLQENAKEDYGNSSLENCINDVNATTGASEVIMRVCKEAGIDADKAKVRDLTVDQIVQIDQEVYNHSSHPKD